MSLRSQRSTNGALLLVVLTAGFNLRTVFASLPPLLDDVRSEVGLSAGVAGLLTTAPVVCFGTFAMLAPRLGRRWSIESTLAVAALLTAFATALRGAGVVGLFAGTVLAGAGVAVSQTLIPILVRLRFVERAAFLTGVFTMALTMGGAAASGLAVPLEHALGGWRAALAIFALPALLAAGNWLVPPWPGSTHVAGVAGPRLERRSGMWSLAAYFGLQSTAFYTGLGWLPSILQAHGFSEGGAGGLLALASAAQFAPAFLIPVLAGRRVRQTDLLVILAAISSAGITGLLLWPAGAGLWMVSLGVGQGGALGLALTLPTLRGASASAVASLTATTLALGYGLASVGPVVAGILHDMTHGWTIVLVFMLVATALQVPAGWQASGDGRTRSNLLEVQSARVR